MVRYFLPALLLSLALSIPAPLRADAPFKIGFIGAFSGPARAWGEACRNGFELGRKRAPAPPYEVAYEDDQFNPAKAVSAFRKLTEIDGATLIISLGSSQGNALAPLAEQKRIPLISWASDARVAAGRRYVIRSWVSGEREGRTMAARALELNYQRPAFIIATNDYSQSVRDGFLRGRAGNVSVSDEVTPDLQDFKPFLLKVRDRGGDAVGMCLGPGQSGLLARQARELGMSPGLFGCDTLHDRREFEVSKGALAGAWLVTGAIAPPFLARYKQVFGNDDAISGAAIHYDLAGILDAALKPGLTADEVVDAVMSSGEGRGASGAFRPVRRDGDQYIELDLITRTIEAAGFTQLSSPFPIKLGAVVSLSGDAARNGQNWLEGAQLAAEELNASGDRVDLLVEDDATVPGRAATAFVKLATVDKVQGIVGGTWDFLAETVYPLARQHRVPFVTPTNPLEVMSAAARENPWIFTNAPSLAAERPVIREFLLKQGIKSLGTITINVPYGSLHAALMKELADELGITLLHQNEVTYSGFHDTIRLGVLKASEKTPDLVFTVLNYEGVDFMLREMERLKIGPQVLMTHTLNEAFDFARSPQRYRRAHGIFPKIADSDFSDRFRKKYSRLPYDYAAAGYDALLFLAKALKAGVNLAAPDAAFEYPGVTGLHRLPAPTRSLVDSRAEILTTHGGKLEAYE